MIRLCFVCMGNICRSPMAEGVFKHLAERAGLRDRFHVESVAIGSWHVGEPYDPRAVRPRRTGSNFTALRRKSSPKISSTLIG